MASKNKEEYRKQLARIKRAMKRLEKAGYTFTESPIPDAEPARVTRKRIEELEAITTRRLYRSTAYIDEGTGELLVSGRPLSKAQRQALASGTQFSKPSFSSLADQEEEQATAQQRAQAPEEQGEAISIAPIDHKWIAIVQAFKDDIRQVAAMMRTNVVPRGDVEVTEPRSLVFIDRLVASFGYERVAKMLEDAISAGETARFEVLYKDTENLRWINTLEGLLQKLSTEEEDIGSSIYQDMHNGNYSRDEIFSAYDDIGDEFEIERG